MEAENTDKAILRRLETLQAFADRQRPALVSVHFTNGTATVTDSGTVLDIFRAHGPSGEIDRFQSDNPIYGPWAQLLTILLYPRENREISDYE